MKILIVRAAITIAVVVTVFLAFLSFSVMRWAWNIYWFFHE